MKYMPVEPYGEWTSAERAELINHELYNLSRPITVKQPTDVTNKLFAEITHPDTDQVALQVDEDYVIKIHPDKNISNLQNLFANLSEEELNGLSAYIDSLTTTVDEEGNTSSTWGTLRFGDIIPSTSVVLTQEEADAAGWFPSEEI